MDPNATLDSIRELVTNFEGGGRFDLADGEKLAELVGALDEWVSKCGFLPDAWRAGKDY